MDPKMFVVLQAQGDLVRAAYRFTKERNSTETDQAAWIALQEAARGLVRAEQSTFTTLSLPGISSGESVSSIGSSRR